MTGSSGEPADLQDAGRATAGQEGREAMAPGDEAPPGQGLAGENLCRACGGSGELDGRDCPACGGTGKTTSVVSGGP